jgi:DNA-binding MarR family transcriptional regulator
MVNKFMDFPVKRDDVARFDELYHAMLRQNLNSKLHYPKELKNLTTIDISVVNIVASNPCIIIREIAEHLKIPNSTLTSSLNRLEKKGIAKRVISARDRRSFSLELTEKGREVQQVHLDFERAFFESILTRLHTHEERKALLDLMEKIVNTCPIDENNLKKVE